MRAVDFGKELLAHGSVQSVRHMVPHERASVMLLFKLAMWTA